MKIKKQDTTAFTIFSTHLHKLISKEDPKRKILDKLDWKELEEYGKKAYASEWYQECSNPRIMIGLFVYSCLVDKTYRELEEDFKYHLICQYACGFTEVKQRNIDHTTLIKFEKNLKLGNVLKIKDMIEKASIENQPSRKKGSHSFDTSVAESNITYPTDTKLMETVRKFLVEDVIKKVGKQVDQEHRHYGRVARKDYVNFCKKRKPKKQEIKKIKKKQLQYLKRNIKQAEKVLEAFEKISQTKQEKKQYKKLKTKLIIAKKIYEQQKDLYEGKKIKNRIVSFHRPEIRPIFRGKTKQNTEFGVKLGMTTCGKVIVLGKMSFDNFHDGAGLRETVQTIKKKGNKINEIAADKGCAGNDRFCKQEGIKNGIERRGKQKAPPEIPKKRFVRMRNEMEGAFGTIKMVFGLMKMRAKTTYGDLLKICKACIGYNLKYAF